MRMWGQKLQRPAKDRGSFQGHVPLTSRKISQAGKSLVDDTSHREGGLAWKALYAWGNRGLDLRLKPQGALKCCTQT